jgi:hypothetical protein
MVAEFVVETRGHLKSIKTTASAAVRLCPGSTCLKETLPSYKLSSTDHMYSFHPISIIVSAIYYGQDWMLNASNLSIRRNSI